VPDVGMYRPVYCSKHLVLIFVRERPYDVSQYLNENAGLVLYEVQHRISSFGYFHLPEPPYLPTTL
jgi:hypothetical protein